MKFAITTSIVFCYLLSYLGASEIIRGKIIEFKIDNADQEIFELEYPRTAKKILKLKEVIALGDKFLLDKFGADFETKLFAISLRKKMGQKGFIWCWSVVYHFKSSPEEDFDDKLALYFSTTGNPLMQVKNNHPNPKDIKQILPPVK